MCIDSHHGFLGVSGMTNSKQGRDGFERMRARLFRVAEEELEVDCLWDGCEQWPEVRAEIVEG